MSDIQIKPEKNVDISAWMSSAHSVFRAVPIGTLIGQNREAYDISAFVRRISSMMSITGSSGYTAQMQQSIAAATLVEIVAVMAPDLAAEISELCFPDASDPVDTAPALLTDHTEIFLVRAGVCCTHTNLDRWSIGPNVYSMIGRPEYTPGSTVEVTGLGVESQTLQVSAKNPATGWVKVWVVDPVSGNEKVSL